MKLHCKMEFDALDQSNLSDTQKAYFRSEPTTRELFEGWSAYLREIRHKRGKSEEEGRLMEPAFCGACGTGNLDDSDEASDAVPSFVDRYEATVQAPPHHPQ